MGKSPRGVTSALSNAILTFALLTTVTQSHKGYVYTSAHGHDVDSLVQIGDGDQFVYIDHLLVGGFSIAPGDADDIEVANAHTWGSYGMVFSDGQVAGTSLKIAECGPSGIGTRCF